MPGPRDNGGHLIEMHLFWYDGCNCESTRFGQSFINLNIFFYTSHVIGNIRVAVPQNHVKWNDLELVLNSLTWRVLPNPILIIIPILISWAVETVLQAVATEITHLLHFISQIMKYFAWKGSMVVDVYIHSNNSYCWGFVVHVPQNLTILSIYKYITILY